MSLRLEAAYEQIDELRGTVADLQEYESFAEDIAGWFPSKLVNVIRMDGGVSKNIDLDKLRKHAADLIERYIHYYECRDKPAPYLLSLSKNK